MHVWGQTKKADHYCQDNLSDKPRGGHGCCDQNDMCKLLRPFQCTLTKKANFKRQGII